MIQAKRLLPLLLALGLALTGCGGNTQEYETEIRQLREENNALTQQVQQLQAQLNQMQYTRLESWNLEARGAGVDSPAEITFSARPEAYEEGLRAELMVTCDGSEATRTPCSWDGEAFQAAVTLQPRDGYGYYCILTTQEGTEEQAALTTPDKPTLPKLVFLKSSLESFVSAYVSDQRMDKGQITVDVTASVQLPLLTADGNPVSVSQASLRWMLDGTLLNEAALELTDGETEGSFSGTVAGFTQTCPELVEGSTLQLFVDARLTDGSLLSCEAASWTGTEDGPEDAVG